MATGASAMGSWTGAGISAGATTISQATGRPSTCEIDSDMSPRNRESIQSRAKSEATPTAYVLSVKPRPTVGSNQMRKVPSFTCSAIWTNACCQMGSPPLVSTIPPETPQSAAVPLHGETGVLALQNACQVGQPLVGDRSVA